MRRSAVHPGNLGSGGKVMKLRFLCVIGILTCGPAWADCLDQQRAIDRMKNGLTPGDATSLGMGCITRPVRAFFNAHESFLRECYAELGLTRLEAQQGVDADEALIARSSGMCR